LVDSVTDNEKNNFMWCFISGIKWYWYKYKQGQFSLSDTQFHVLSTLAEGFKEGTVLFVFLIRTSISIFITLPCILKKMKSF
jgi:hypothetical protein